MNKLSTFIIILSFFLAQCQKRNEFISDSNYSYKAETVVGNLDIAWGMVFLPDGSMLIAEQEGKLIHFKDNRKTLVKNIPEVFYKNQGGLMDLELHPDYINNGWIYMSYSGNTEKDGKGANTVIVRAKLNEGQLVDQEILYKATPNTNKAHHFGSRLEFGIH